MKRWLLAAAVIFTCGCAVEAEESMCTYTATVIESGDEEVVLELNPDESSLVAENEDSTGTDETGADHDCEHEYLTLHEDDQILVLDDERMISLKQLNKDDQVILTMDHDRAVIHTDHTGREDKTGENSPNDITRDMDQNQN